MENEDTKIHTKYVDNCTLEIRTRHLFNTVINCTPDIVQLPWIEVVFQEEGTHSRINEEVCPYRFILCSPRKYVVYSLRSTIDHLKNFLKPRVPHNVTDAP